MVLSLFKVKIQFIYSIIQCFKSTDPCFTQICKSAQDCEDAYQNGSESGGNYKYFFLIFHRIFFLMQHLFLDLCPTVFDGWTCINAVPAGQVANVSCPVFDNFNYHAESK